MEKVNIKRMSHQSLKNFTTNLSLEYRLASEPLPKIINTVPVIIENQKSPKPHPFYQNLLEVVKKGKEPEIMILKQKSLPPLQPVNPKKLYQKSQTEEGALLASDESFVKRTERVHMPLNIVINNIFQFGNEEHPTKEDFEALQRTSDTSSSKTPHSFVNRFNSLEEDADLKVKDPHKINEHPFRHLIFNKQSSITRKAFLTHLKSIQKGLIYAKTQIKPPDQAKIAPKTVPLDPLPEGMKTLVLDLDGTLVHVADQRTDSQSHVTLKMKVEEGNHRTFGIRFRPYLYYFLEKMSKNYEIIIFTAGHASYASAVVDYIDPERKFIKYVISRDRCLVTRNGLYIKDLRILAKRDLKDVLIVDNVAHSFCLQVSNGIPILNYQDDPDDKELKYLAKYLTKCAETRNLREFNGQYLQLNELMDMDLSEKGHVRALSSKPTY